MLGFRFFTSFLLTVIVIHWLILLGGLTVSSILVPKLAASPLPAQTTSTKVATDPTSSLETPLKVVEDLHMALIKVMQSAQILGWQGRYDRLYPILSRAYNFNDMARIAAGSYWKTFSEAQKVSVVEAFSRMSIATYASRFDAYGGERFETIAVEELPQLSLGVMVQTRLIKKAEGSEIKLSYRLTTTEQGWKIVDVFYRGTVSELANQRAQYLTVLSQLGYNGLLQKLDEKVKKLAIGQKGSKDMP